MPVNTEPAPRPPLDNTRLVAALGANPRLSVEIVAETASTNASVAERAKAGGVEGLVVVAEHQTAGRGRLDRRWEAPTRSGLAFSLLVRPEVPSVTWSWLPLLTGYAVTQALVAAGYEAGVKWPNDVLIGGRKVAGILVERVETPTGPAAVLGVGLNTDLKEEELPVPTATALNLAAGPDPDRTDLLVGILTAIQETYDAWHSDPLAAARLTEAYTEGCITLGQVVRVELPDGSTLAGEAVDIDPDGRLVVVTGATEHRVAAGDVVHVRPVDPNQ